MEAGKRTAGLCRHAVAVAAFAAVFGVLAQAASAAPWAFSPSSPWNTPAAQRGPISSNNPYASLFTSYDPGLVLGGGPAGSDSHDRDYAKPTYFAEPRRSLPDGPPCAIPTGRTATSDITAECGAGPAGRAGRRRLGRPSRDHLRGSHARLAMWRCKQGSDSGARAPRPMSWRAATTPPTWRCGTSAGRASRSAVATPREGSGTPLYPTVLTAADALAGFQHALGITVPSVSSSYVYPAVKSDGSCGCEIKYGMLFVLRRDFPENDRSAGDVIQALKTYGAYIVDQGASFEIDTEGDYAPGAKQGSPRRASRNVVSDIRPGDLRYVAQGGPIPAAARPPARSARRRAPLPSRRCVKHRRRCRASTSRSPMRRRGGQAVDQTGKTGHGHGHRAAGRGAQDGTDPGRATRALAHRQACADPQGQVRREGPRAPTLEASARGEGAREGARRGLVTPRDRAGPALTAQRRTSRWAAAQAPEARSRRPDGRHLGAEAAVVIVPVDPHTRVAQRPLAGQPCGQCAGRAVAGPLGGLHHPVVVVPIGIGDRPARPPEAFSSTSREPRSSSSSAASPDTSVRCGWDLVWDPTSQPSSRESLQLVPAHRDQLRLVGTAHPLVDPGPGHRALGADVVGGRIHGAGEPQFRQDRACHLPDRAVCVVEGDGHHSALLRRGDRIGERGAAVAAADKHGELVLEPLGGDRKVRCPAGADGVVAEHQPVARQRSAGPISVRPAHRPQSPIAPSSTKFPSTQNSALHPPAPMLMQDIGQCRKP